ncbi:tetratricopeptide repeat protein [Ekhidna sp. To15]|uniref:tetratricopeptide repeat protein n=1 Tax=Ekhidna sp. To15 TaxID=3395267 RepID=UPI003F5280EA
MKHIKKILSGLVFLTTACAFGQVNIDSLLTIWNDTSQPDTTRLEAINTISWNGYLFTQSDSAYYFAQKQLEFARERNLPRQMSQALNTQGVYFHLQGNYADSREVYLKSLQLREEIDDKKGVGASCNNLGLSYTATGDYDKALVYFLRSLKIREEFGDKNDISTTVNNIGNVYLRQGDYSNALDHYTRGLQLIKGAADKKRQATFLNNIGIIYHKQEEYEEAHYFYDEALKLREELGDSYDMAASISNIADIYSIREDYEKAIEYYQKSLKISEEVGDKSGVSTCLASIGTDFKSQKMYDTALYYIRRGLQISEEIGDRKNVSLHLSNIGDIYYERGDYKSALEFNKRSLRLAQEIGANAEIQYSAESLWKIYKKLNRFNDALIMYELAVSTKDSIYTEDSKRNIIQLKYKYAYEKKALADSVTFVKQQEISNLKIAEQEAQIRAERYILVFLVSIISLGLIFALFLYKSYKKRERAFSVIKKQKILLEKANEEIRIANESLEKKVRDRTQKIQFQNDKLRKHAFAISHLLRAPLVRLLSVVQFIEYEESTSKENAELLKNVVSSANEMDDILKKMTDTIYMDDDIKMD